MTLSELLNSNNKTSERLGYYGYIMNKDIKVARVENNIVVGILNEDMCPLIIVRNRDFIQWVMTRTIDTHRTNSRLLRKILRLKEPESIDIAIKSRCRTITDYFWFKEDKSKETFENLKFEKDLLKDIALHGKIDSLEIDDTILTPELTNIGSYEKAWVIGDNKEWYLRKKANELEILSEIFVYKLCDFMGMDNVEYKRVGTSNVIECKNFIKEAEWFEPAFYYIGEVEDYKDNYDMLSLFEKRYNVDSLCKCYLDILFIDALVQNPDRHTFNYGIIRKDGNIIKMAPNFDNNLSLVATGLNKKMTTLKNLLISEFLDLLYVNKIDYKIKELTLEDLINILKECCIENAIISINQEDIINIGKYVMNNYNLIKENMNKA